MQGSKIARDLSDPNLGEAVVKPAQVSDVHTGETQDSQLPKCAMTNLAKSPSGRESQELG